MERKNKRTIIEVLDYETGECINANIFFKKPLDEVIEYRSKLQQAIENFIDPIFGCYYCKQKIRIRGRITSNGKQKVESFHFAHLRDSDECHIKTKNNFSKDEVDRIKYNGAKESILHQKLKEQIAESLLLNQTTKKEISNIEVEKVIKNKLDKEWKKPDINAFFNDKRIAIELQLSTTWLDVITRRQHFYKEEGIYIFWVFAAFNTNDDLRKLTFDDVIYTNNQNAFVFDEETYKLSISQNDLFLKCSYKTYFRNENKLVETWENSIVKLSDLIFDEKKIRIYFHDAETQKRIVQKDINFYISHQKELIRLQEIREEEQEKEYQEKERIHIYKEKQKEAKRKEIEQLINNLISEITIVRKDIIDIEQKKKKENNELKLLNEFVLKIEEYLEKTVTYLADKLGYSKPFYYHNEFLQKLKDEFSQALLLITDTIKVQKEEQCNYNNQISDLKKIPIVSISGAIYSSLDSTTYWNFIKKNYPKIKTINKKFIDSLYASEEINSIQNEIDLNRLQFAKDILFLIDFNPMMEDLKKKDIVIEETLNQLELKLKAIRNEIKISLINYFQNKISGVESKLEEYLNTDSIFKDEIFLKENEIAKLENDLNSII